jgi:hypothetical protein
MRIPDSFTASFGPYIFQWWILISIVTPAAVTRAQCLFDCACMRQCTNPSEISQGDDGNDGETYKDDDDIVAKRD